MSVVALAPIPGSLRAKFGSNAMRSAASMHRFIAFYLTKTQDQRDLYFSCEVGGLDYNDIKKQDRAEATVILNLMAQERKQLSADITVGFDFAVGLAKAFESANKPLLWDLRMMQPQLLYFFPTHKLSDYAKYFAISLKGTGTAERNKETKIFRIMDEIVNIRNSALVRGQEWCAREDGVARRAALQDDDLQQTIALFGEMAFSAD